MPRASYDIEQNNKLVMIRPKGAWSEELATRLVDQVNQLYGGDKIEFAGLIDLRMWELGTPKALEIIGKHLFDSAAKGYRLEIHFGEPKAIPMLISKQNITPDEVTLVQSSSIQDIIDVCMLHGYPVDRRLLESFLKID